MIDLPRHCMLIESILIYIKPCCCIQGTQWQYTPVQNNDNMQNFNNLLLLIK